MGVNVEKMLQDMKDCLGWPYSSPGGTSKDCSTSGIDCSGMFVRAFKLQKFSIAHGSNSIWRNGSLSEKGKINSVNDLKPGYAVFLNKPWAEKDKRNKYYGDSDGNMSHIGAVLSVNPLVIIDASYSAGKVRTTETIKKVGWTHWGKLAKVQYSVDDISIVNDIRTQAIEMKTAVVVAEQGSTVNLRTRASKNSGVQFRVPIGETVTLLSDKVENNFYHVQYGRWKGYMMKNFLEVCEG